jgi:hypothetical protein
MSALPSRRLVGGQLDDPKPPQPLHVIRIQSKALALWRNSPVVPICPEYRKPMVLRTKRKMLNLTEITYRCETCGTEMVKEER